MSIYIYIHTHIASFDSSVMFIYTDTAAMIASPMNRRFKGYGGISSFPP